MNGDQNEHELVILHCTCVLCADCIDQIFNTQRLDGAGHSIPGTNTTKCPFCNNPNSIRPIPVEKRGRKLVPRQILLKNKNANKTKGVIDDRRLYTEQWGEKHAPHDT
jgi:hypothetical protein